jgi:hypothetical protein
MSWLHECHTRRPVLVQQPSASNTKQCQEPSVNPSWLPIRSGDLVSDASSLSEGSNSSPFMYSPPYKLQPPRRTSAAPISNSSSGGRLEDSCGTIWGPKAEAVRHEIQMLREQRAEVLQRAATWGPDTHHYSGRVCSGNVPVATQSFRGLGLTQSATDGPYGGAHHVPEVHHSASGSESPIALRSQWFAITPVPAVPLWARRLGAVAGPHLECPPVKVDALRWARRAVQTAGSRDAA